MTPDFWDAEDVIAVTEAAMIGNAARKEWATHSKLLDLVMKHRLELICLAPSQTGRLLAALSQAQRKINNSLFVAARMQREAEQRVARREQIEMDFVKHLQSLGTIARKN